MKWTSSSFFSSPSIAVVCGINVVVQTHPISSALSLIGVMGSLAVLYLLLGAEFIAMAQVIVYAGAIMVLFVFVIMLLNAGAEPARPVVHWSQLLGVPAPDRACWACSATSCSAVSRIRHVHFGGFTGGTARSRPRAVHRVSAALRSHLRADPDRHHRRDRACPKGDWIDACVLTASRFPGTSS